MKYKKIIRRVSAMLCGIMVLSLCGCGNESTGAETKIEPMEEEQVATYSFDFIGGTDVMPISGFYGPFPSTESINGNAVPDYINDEIFQMIVDCGINLIAQNTTNYNTAPQYVKKMLELAEKYGIGCTVYDPGLPHGEGALSLSDTAARVNEYCNYPAFCGVTVVDEPAMEGFYYKEERTIDKYVEKNNNLVDLGIWTYTNLYPLHNPNNRDIYDRYLETWLSSCKEEVLLWDHYVFSTGDNPEPDYFYNMSICRKKAEEYGIPFWTYIQAGSQWNVTKAKFDTEGYYPNEGELLWNVNTSLAFGAKGISYFPIIQPLFYSYAESTPYDFERNGLLGVTGNKNRWWYYAQKANKQIAAVDQVLMNSVNKGIIVTGADAERDAAVSTYVLEGHSWRELVNVSGDTMIGCFNYYGKSAYYVVNYDREYAQHIELEFYDNCDFTVTQNAETTNYNGNGITLTMAAGEGVLIVME